MCSTNLTQHYFQNCSFNSTNFITNLSSILQNSAIAFDNCEMKDASVINRVYQVSGYIEKDITNYRTGSICVGMNFISNSIAVTQKFNVMAVAGTPIAVTGYIKKTSDYTDVANPTVALSGAGMTTNVWTMPDTHDEWIQFVVIGTPTENTQALLTISGQSAAGAIYFDDFIFGILNLLKLQGQELLEN